MEVRTTWTVLRFARFNPPASRPKHQLTYSLGDFLVHFPDYTYGNDFGTNNSFGGTHWEP